jgi:hypothetical protein
MSTTPSPPPFGWIFLKGDPKVASQRLSLSASFHFAGRENLQISEGGVVSALWFFFLGIQILLTSFTGGGGGVDIKWNGTM